MALNHDLFIHPTDQAAMKALKAIPGFHQFVKAYMSIWNERHFRIVNMSSFLRISDQQMKKYHDMLVPICDKLGIVVPELYIKLDVNPNAYTYGDKEPFIVVTSGLFETMPEELIPTVLAHECGHIACHHTLYTTMGQMILNGMINLPGMAAVTIPLQMAFSYWMRCSELSADRAAAIYDGSPDKTIELCMRLAGYDKDIQEEGNVDAFLQQAEDYLQLVNDSVWNRTLEFMIVNSMSHPLNAVRAYECRAWGNSEQFAKICQYIEQNDTTALYVREVPAPCAAKDFVGKTADEAAQKLIEAGFTNIARVRSMEKQKGIDEQQVVAVSIAGEIAFDMGTWFADDAEVVLTYYEAETMEEAILAHQGKRPVPEAAKKYVGRNVTEVVNELSDAGFTNIVTDPQETKKSLFTKEGAIVRVTIGGQGGFDKGDWFEPNAVVRISYVTLV